MYVKKKQIAELKVHEAHSFEDTLNNEFNVTVDSQNHVHVLKFVCQIFH